MSAPTLHCSGRTRRPVHQWGIRQTVPIAGEPTRAPEFSLQLG